MADHSVNELLSLINKQTQIQEVLFNCLSKADAIAHVALSDGFLDYKRSIIHAYLWALCDAINEAKNITEEALDHLLTVG
jgi:hypothetical protein